MYYLKILRIGQSAEIGLSVKHKASSQRLPMGNVNTINTVNGIVYSLKLDICYYMCYNVIRISVSIHIHGGNNMKNFLDYVIYEDGRIWSNITNRFLKPALCGSKKQYRFVQLRVERKKYKQFYVHRLVATLYCENKENKPNVNHIDRNTENNHYTNLEWVTQKENINHSINCGVSPIKNFREVLLYKDNKYVGEFKSKIACARYCKENGGYKAAMDKYMFDSTGFKAYYKYQETGGIKDRDGQQTTGR